VENSNGGKKSPTQLPDSLPVEKPSQPKSTEPAKQIAQPSAAPVGIPHFVQIREQLSNGLRPSLDDGMDWLQSHGYKTVLYIHNPATSANADRKQVEKRGMKFIDLELSPGTLSRQDSDEFSRIVNDKAAAPLFVYDRDGSLTGGLWYLHFRLTQQLSEEVARSQARSLGLRENGEGSHREMWLAAEALARDAGQKR
jgi:hypothetical protein